ncbi:GAF domain-containing protein [Anaerosporobacter mobilis DSM 15930]|jgi:acetolactate synthase-1/2/3 large subunit|uniref:GAF domain-containing protein n=1 Tax=Anaerosporobacter mobilis DSM 15930 TaxID=1120996 RepID=A0A1M7HUZ9_9FIRM|nr:GAF domain-containing protein [Anaerosporobacter mobilis]SHM32173.1 GAF domain-containing protein [Anaerosporobacter mobilis DSM 15930]
MDKQILANLFQKISDITKVMDIGYHHIVDGHLSPVYKTQTDVLGIEKWITVHGQNPVYVKDTYILKEITEKKQPVEIYDIDNDSRSADAFFLFGLKSIMIIPVVRDDEVNAIICIASIGKLHQFTDEEIKVCCDLADEYLQEQY